MCEYKLIPLRMIMLPTKDPSTPSRKLLFVTNRPSQKTMRSPNSKLWNPVPMDTYIYSIPPALKALAGVIVDQGVGKFVGARGKGNLW